MCIARGCLDLRVPKELADHGQAVGWGSGGTRYAHEMAERARQSTVEMALKDIADVLGDVDGFIAHHDPKTRKVPKIAAKIAQRLLAAGRAGDALGFIERAEVKEARRIPPEWQDARLAVLDALDRKEDAQAFRWACFERDLAGEHLRDYVKRLPDFEDIEAEERALAHAAGHTDLLAALAFFLNWPSLAHAARLKAEHGKKTGFWSRMDG